MIELFEFVAGFLDFTALSEFPKTKSVEDLTTGHTFHGSRNWEK